MPSVIDTNVLVVANGGDSHPQSCAAACAGELGRIKKNGVIVLDAGGLIVNEYKGNLLSSRRQDGAGLEFLLWLFQIQWTTSRCTKIPITPRGNERESDFIEFPASPDLSGFDRSDRKFVAVSLAHPERPSILAALDTDWWFYRKPLEDAGVKVRFVCPKEIADYAGRKKPSGKR
jgi:hypothetical protein